MEKKIFLKSLFFSLAFCIVIASTGLNAKAGNTDPVTTAYVFSTTLTLDPAMTLGKSQYGTRTLSVISGGTFSGDKLRGTIHDGGVSWKLVRPDGDTEYDMRYTMEADDGALIFVNNKCLVSGTYMRCAPSFEANLLGDYVWLNSAFYLAKLATTTTTQTITVFKLK